MTPEQLKTLQKVHDTCSGDDGKHCDMRASRMAMYSDDNTTTAAKPAGKGKPGMTLIEQLKALFAKAGVPKEDVDQLKEDAPATTVTLSSGGAVDFSKSAEFAAVKSENEALKAKTEAQDAQIASFAAKFADAEKAAQLSKDSAELDKLSALPFAKITPAEADGYRKIAQENPAAFAAVLPMLKERPVLAQFDRTVRLSEDADDPGAKLTKLANERAAKGETYVAAFNAVCLENPELAAAHNANMTGGN